MRPEQSKIHRVLDFLGSVRGSSDVFKQTAERGKKGRGTGGGKYLYVCSGSGVFFASLNFDFKFRIFLSWNYFQYLSPKS